VTAARALNQLVEYVKSAYGELWVARTKQPVLEQMTDAGLIDAIGQERFSATVSSAVERPRATPAPTTVP
jgi:hypothetical protein